jgi:hypothetical protein
VKQNHEAAGDRVYRPAGQGELEAEAEAAAAAVRGQRQAGGGQGRLGRFRQPLGSARSGFGFGCRAVFPVLVVELCDQFLVLFGRLNLLAVTGDLLAKRRVLFKKLALLPGEDGVAVEGDQGEAEKCGQEDGQRQQIGEGNTDAVGLAVMTDDQEVERSFFSFPGGNGAPPA